MGNKKFIINTFLVTISKSITFCIVIDNFSELNSPYPYLPNTDLITVCSVQDIGIQRTFQPNEGQGVITRVLTFGGKAEYNGSTPIQFNYSPTDGFFDLSGFPIFRINFISAVPFDINMSLKDANNNSIVHSTILVNDLLQIFDFTSEFTIPLNETSFNPQMVQTISFNFNTESAADIHFTLASLEAVPEPISIITLGSGIGTLIRKRKKSAYKFNINNI